MLDTNEIKDWIAASLICEHLEVTGDGRHFEAVVVSDAFAGLSRIQRQQLVNEALREHFDTGDLHALSMRTLTPEEWRARG